MRPTEDPTLGWIPSLADPVASLSVLREVHAPPILRNCIFGEATLNDALSIVVFHVIRQHYYTLGDSKDEMAAAGLAMARDLTWAMTGSVVTGCAFALSAAYLTRRILYLRLSSQHVDATENAVPHAELALLSTHALLTFSAAERFGFSGIASIFVCGILTRHYTYHNLSKAAQGAAETLYASIALLCENALATMLGVAAFDYLSRLDPSHVPLAMLNVPVLFIARALNIFPLSALCNFLRRKSHKTPIDWRMQLVMWFSGMRGALCFGLVITLDDNLFPHPVSSS